MDDAAVRARREQNLAAARTDARGIAPSIRNFAQAIDRQRQAVEHVPVLAASRAGLFEAARALDEAEVAAIAMTVDDPAAEVPMFARAAQAVSVPVLRCDLLLDKDAGGRVVGVRILGGEHQNSHDQRLLRINVVCEHGRNQRTPERLTLCRAATYSVIVGSG